MSADWSDGGRGNADSPEIREPPLSMVRWLERVRSVEDNMKLEEGIALRNGPIVLSTNATCPIYVSISRRSRSIPIEGTNQTRDVSRRQEAE